jgi:predicted deacylase
MTKGKRFILNIGTHGDEQIGLKVAREIEKLTIIQGELIVNVANPKAFQVKKRFIDEDLNRAFPGKKNGNYEQNRAYELVPLIKSADVVVDIHSTTSELKDALIVTKLDKKTKEYLRVISPKYALVMNATKNNAFISYAKTGIAFEYGKDKDPKVAKKIILDITKLLVHLGMISNPNKAVVQTVTTFFDVYTSVVKPKGAVLDGKTKNYVLVKKGQVYARIHKKELVAEKDFYPILFGNKNYKEIFGFAGKKIV